MKTKFRPKLVRRPKAIVNGDKNRRDPTLEEGTNQVQLLSGDQQEPEGKCEINERGVVLCVCFVGGCVCD